MQSDSAAPVMAASESDDSATVTVRDRDEMQVDNDYTTASSLTAPAVDARTTDAIEDDAAPSILVDAATKHTEPFDAAAVGNRNHTDGTEDSKGKHAGNAAVNGKQADAPAQQEEASPSSNNTTGGNVDVVPARELIQALASAGAAAEVGASHMIVTVGAVDDAAAVEAVLGYTFTDKSLLEAALTHSSFRGTGAGVAENYERLEFLGDRVIGAAVARHMYRAHPGLGPGSLSRLNELNVGTEKLGRAAVARGLHRFLRHEMPSFALHVDEFVAEAAAYPVYSNGQMTAPPKPLADLVESLMGAVFLDSGSDHERLWQTFQRVADPLIGPEMLPPRRRQPRWELDSLCRDMGLSAPKIQKKDWARSHTVTVVVDGETVGSATYSKRQVVAQNRAIVAALNTIKARMASSTEALLKGEEAAAGSSPSLKDEEAIPALQVPTTLGKRHVCCRDDVAATASNKRFKTSSWWEQCRRKLFSFLGKAMAESEHSKMDSEGSHP